MVRWRPACYNGCVLSMLSVAFGIPTTAEFHSRSPSTVLLEPARPFASGVQYDAELYAARVERRLLGINLLPTCPISGYAFCLLDIGTCCPLGGDCCGGGKCCGKLEYCIRTLKGPGGCCKIGKICSANLENGGGAPPPPVEEEPVETPKPIPSTTARSSTRSATPVAPVCEYAQCGSTCCSRGEICGSNGRCQAEPVEEEEEEDEPEVVPPPARTSSSSSSSSSKKTEESTTAQPEPTKTLEPAREIIVEEPTRTTSSESENSTKAAKTSSTKSRTTPPTLAHQRNTPVQIVTFASTRVVAKAGVMDQPLQPIDAAGPPEPTETGSNPGNKPSSGGIARTWNKLPTGGKIGLIIGCLAIGVLAVVLALYIIRARKRRQYAVRSSGSDSSKGFLVPGGMAQRWSIQTTSTQSSVNEIITEPTVFTPRVLSSFDSGSRRPSVVDVSNPTASAFVGSSAFASDPALNNIPSLPSPVAGESSLQNTRPDSITLSNDFSDFRFSTGAQK